MNNFNIYKDSRTDESEETQSANLSFNHPFNAAAIANESCTFRDCSRLEAKCLLGIYLKIPYDLRSELSKVGINRLIDLRNKDRDDLTHMLNVSIKRLSLLIESLEQNGLKFPLSYPHRVRGTSEDFSAVFIDSPLFPNALLSTDFCDKRLHFSTGLISKLEKMKLYTIRDLVGISRQDLQSGYGIGLTTIEKMMVSIARYAGENDIGDPEFKASIDANPGEIKLVPKNTCDTRSSNALPNPELITPLADGVNLDDYQLSLKLEDFEFTPAMQKALHSLGYTTVADLVGKTVYPLLAMKGIGRRSLSKFRQALIDGGIPISGFQPNTAYNKRNHRDAFENFTPSNEIIQLVGEEYTYSPLKCEILFDSERGFYSPIALKSCGSLHDWLVSGATDTNEPINLSSLGQYRTASIVSIAKEDFASGFETSNTILHGENSKALTEILFKKYEHSARIMPALFKDFPFGMLHRIVIHDLSLENSLTVKEALEMSKTSVGFSYICEMLATILSESLALAAQANSSNQLIDQVLVDSYPDASVPLIQKYKHRHGIGCRKLTLQEIADECNLTRERIRQIVKRLEKEIRFESSLRLLAPRILLVSLALSKNALGNAPRAHETFCNDPKLLSLVCPEVMLFDSEFSITPQLQTCSNCERLNVLLNSLDEYDVLSFEELYSDSGCTECPSHIKPSASFIKSISHLEVAENLIGCKSNPIIKSALNPNNTRATVASILYMSETPLSLDDMRYLFREKTGRELSKYQAMSYMGSVKKLRLMGTRYVFQSQICT